MTTDEFIEELKQYNIRFKPGLWNPKNVCFRTKEGLCPICALIDAKGIVIKEQLVNHNAAFLGPDYLGLENTEDIMKAADFTDKLLNEEQLRIKKAFEEMVI